MEEYNKDYSNLCAFTGFLDTSMQNLKDFLHSAIFDKRRVQIGV